MKSTAGCANSTRTAKRDAGNGAFEPAHFRPHSGMAGPAHDAPAMVYPISLADLLTGARSRQAAGESQWDILKWMYGVADHYGIRVRSEQRVETASGAASDFSTTPSSSPLGAPVTAVAQPPIASLEASPVLLSVEPVTAPSLLPAGSVAALGMVPAGAVPAKDEATQKEEDASAPEEDAIPTELIAGPEDDADDELVSSSAGAKKAGAGPAAKPNKKKLKKKEKLEEKAARTIPVVFRRAQNGRSYIVLEHLLDPGFDPRTGGPVPAGPEVARTGRDATAEITRIILSCDRHIVKGGGLLCAECNGAVIDARTWTPLAVPPRAFNPRVSARNIDELLARSMFDILPVPDGTVITLYPWNPVSASPDMGRRDGCWALASSNGYDVSSMRWMGPHTYSEVFFSIAEQYPDLIARTGMAIGRYRTEHGELTYLTCRDLDRTRCYTVGFRHHDFHPMKWDAQRAWQIQYSLLETGRTACADDGGGLPGLPWQTAVEPSELVVPGTAALAAAIPSATIITAPLTLGRLVELCEPAFENAKRMAAAWAAHPDEAQPSPCYGFILRSKDPQATGEHSDFLIESPLLRKVRRVLYARPARAVRTALDHGTRLEHNALRTYLTSVDRDDLVALFPDWKARFAAYDEFIGNVVRGVIHIHRQVSMGPASKEPVARTPVMLVARALLSHITRQEPQLNAFHVDTESIIRDYVVSPEYSLIYAKAMAGRAS